MRSIHRYLASLLNSRPRRVLVAGAAVPALLLALAACGSAASASPAAGSSASPAAGSSSSPGSGSAYFNCLREHGVTGGYGGRSSSGSSSSGSSSSGSSSSGSTPSSAAINSARQACASLRPSGGFGGSVGFSAAFQKFESCLSAHGVTLPSGSSSGEGFRGLFADLQSGSPADKAAFNACKSDLPFTPGGSFGGGSTSGGSTST